MQYGKFPLLRDVDPGNQPGVLCCSKAERHSLGGEYGGEKGKSCQNIKNKSRRDYLRHDVRVSDDDRVHRHTLDLRFD